MCYRAVLGSYTAPCMVSPLGSPRREVMFHFVGESAPVTCQQSAELGSDRPEVDAPGQPGPIFECYL